MVSSFGATTFLIPWSENYVQRVMRAVERGHAPLAGVRLKIIKRMDELESGFCGWGESWVAASLPIEIFLEVEEAHLSDRGTLDLTHAVSTALLKRMPDDEEW